MAALPPFPIKGPALIDGNALDAMVQQINNLTGNGTAGAVTATTISATGLASLSGGINGLIGSTAAGATAQLGNFRGVRDVVTTISTTAGVKVALGLLQVTTTAVKTYKLGAPTKGALFTINGGNSTGVTFGTTTGIVFSSTSGSGRTTLVLKSKFATVTLRGISSTGSVVVSKTGTVTV